MRTTCLESRENLNRTTLERKIMLRHMSRSTSSLIRRRAVQTRVDSTISRAHSATEFSQKSIILQPSQTICRYIPANGRLGAAVFLLGCGSCYYGSVSSRWGHSTTVVQCEQATMVKDSPSSNLRIQLGKPPVNKNDQSLLKKVRRALKILRRLFKLMIAVTPVALLYPLHYLLTASSSSSSPDSSQDTTDAHQLALASLQRQENGLRQADWYFILCLKCVEFSGAAGIKIMQWAGSRPDIFGQDFCRVFSQLQDDTTPHSWRHTKRVLEQAYGENWQEHIRLEEILGSGCIAQVYKGYILPSNDENSEEKTPGSRKEQPVAVKIMHPNVEDDIDADLDILRLIAYAVEWAPIDLLKDLKWLNLPGIAEEMASLLKIQLDLRTEADHLNRFNENFKDNDVIEFPKLVEGYKPNKHVLIETFMEGDSVMEFIRKNSGNQRLLSKMCTAAIQAVCQMLFINNFVHSDLHPGNVLISPDEKFILLDAGIVVENSRSDHRLISDILVAFIRKQGRIAGQLMIDDSNSRLSGQGDHALDEEQFLDKIESLTIKASTKGYLMENLGTYIAFICDAAATHHVMLNQSFISAALAVKVQEGMALALDPSIPIWRVANPIILEGERRQGMVGQRVKEMTGLDGFVDYLFGSKPPKSKRVDLLDQ